MITQICEVGRRATSVDHNLCMPGGHIWPRGADQRALGGNDMMMRVNLHSEVISMLELLYSLWQAIGWSCTGTRRKPIIIKAKFILSGNSAR